MLMRSLLGSSTEGLDVLGEPVLPLRLILPRPPVLSLLLPKEGRGEISDKRPAQRAASLLARLCRPQRRLPAVMLLLVMLLLLLDSRAWLMVAAAGRAAASCCISSSWLSSGAAVLYAAGFTCCPAWMALRSATSDLCKTAAAMVASRGGPHCVFASICSSVSKNLQPHIARATTRQATQ
jgi:hypothetical protein